jgi:hypothetical protein
VRGQWIAIFPHAGGNFDVAVRFKAPTPARAAPSPTGGSTVKAETLV